MNKMATAMQEGEYDAEKPQGKVFVWLNSFTVLISHGEVPSLGLFRLILTPPIRLFQWK